MHLTQEMRMKEV
jgi:formyltetrahydrofolate hydrolase